MKLNTKRTMLVGLGFFTICTFWQLYNNAIPLMLKETFHLNDTIAGFIMGADNILALFMLPLFGMLSDKTNTRLGKRMPYIVGGTLLAAVSMILVAIFDAQARLLPFAIALGVLLIAMSTYRSPTVAMMPDITPKPLLSKGNAIINLLGTFGGILALLLIPLLSPGSKFSNLLTQNLPSLEGSYLFLFGAVAIIMLLGVIVLLLFFKENKSRKEKENIEQQETLTAPDTDQAKEKMSKDKLKSLIFLLGSIFLWFFGYNAIVSAYSKYAVTIWHLDGGLYAYALLVAQATALIAFIPIGYLATKIGRKKTIFIGIATLTIAFGSVMLFKEFSLLILVLFGLAGIGWAAINVNSYPMVVSLSKGSDIGKYTGYYYTASMASQILTPIISGALLQYVGYWTLFPYGAVFVALSAVTLYFVKHGDSKPLKVKDKIEAFDVED